MSLLRKTTSLSCQSAEKARRSKELARHGGIDRGDLLHRRSVDEFRARLAAAPQQQLLIAQAAERPEAQVEEAPAAAAAAASTVDSSRIVVAVRKRPLLRREQEAGDFDVLSCDLGGRSVGVHRSARELVSFGFDHVFDEHASSDQLYETAVGPQ
eukprot:COSAG01_NODE_2504_length_7555_cov_3.189646_6_plen_155_part_00